MMDSVMKASAEAARGFMPPDEGVALHEAALLVSDGAAPMLEIGSSALQQKSATRSSLRSTTIAVLKRTSPAGNGMSPISSTPKLV